jgi:hypothetical protein
MAIDLKPFHVQVVELIVRIDALGAGGEEAEIATQAVRRFTAEGGIIQAAIRQDDPIKYVRGQASLAADALDMDLSTSRAATLIRQALSSTTSG